MNPSIEELQQRIAALQTASVAKDLTSSQPVDIKELIRDVVREELPSLKDSSHQQIKPMTLLESIGCSLTTEEQVWLSKPDVLIKASETLPLFFQQEEGKNSVRSFLKYLRGSYEA